MLQLCATVLNVTWFASLKMNEMLINVVFFGVSVKNTSAFSLRQLTLFKGATAKSVRECNLQKNAIYSRSKLM